jgi:hypothetical protein
MTILDYNQQLLDVPRGHLKQNLGHPTKNRPPIDDLQIPAHRPFKVIDHYKSLQCQVFEGIVYYGLGHTTRVVQLGKYRPDISLSELFWDCDQQMIIISHQQGVSLRHGRGLAADQHQGRDEIHAYTHHLPTPLDLCPCGECQDEMSAD